MLMAMARFYVDADARMLVETRQPQWPRSMRRQAIKIKLSGLMVP